MITSALLYVIGALLGIMISLLGLLSNIHGIFYPPEFLAALKLFGGSLASVNFLFDTYDVAAGLIFFTQFITYYFSAFLIIFIIKRTRGG